jgi:hypothetical protein
MEAVVAYFVDPSSCLETEKATKNHRQDGQSRVGTCTRDLQNTKQERYPLDPDVR